MSTSSKNDGATETSLPAGMVFHINHPGPTQECGFGESSFASGALKTATTSTDQASSDPETLAAMLEPALAEAISTGHQQIASAVHCARQHAATALTAALRTGALLVEVHRRHEKAGWGAWVEKNCPQLPISTAYRYMGLARKFPHVRMGQEILGLRQAYIAVGMMPEKAGAKNKKAPDLTSVPPSTGTDVVARMQSSRAFLGAELESVNPATLNDTARKSLLAEINALIGWLTEIRESISHAQQVVGDDATGTDEKEAA